MKEQAYSAATGHCTDTSKGNSVLWTRDRRKGADPGLASGTILVPLCPSISLTLRNSFCFGRQSATFRVKNALQCKWISPGATSKDDFLVSTHTQRQTKAYWPAALTRHVECRTRGRCGRPCLTSLACVQYCCALASACSASILSVYCRGSVDPAILLRCSARI